MCANSVEMALAKVEGVELPTDEARALEVDLADAFKRRFITRADKLKQTREQKRGEELL